MNVKLPRLLDKNLKEVKRLHPKAQSAEINLTPLSTASLTLRDGEGVRVRDFIELYNARGSVGIFRVKAPNNGYGTSTDTVSLEHGVSVLGDAIIPAEGTIKGTAREVFTFLMGYQSAKVGGVPMWTLGDVDVPDSEEVTYDYRFSNTLHALLDVLNQLDGYMMQFDQSAFPWVMHIRAMETAPSCEGRLSRNVVTAHVTIDDSELCTRVYSPRLPGGYMQLEENPEWGVIEQPLDFADEIPLETVIEECQKYLGARKAPAIAVEIDGFELAATTGEALDSFDVGRMMRLALPAYGVTVEERITAISYASMLSQPETVRIYLANQLPDVSMSVSNVSYLRQETQSLGNWRTKTEKEVTNLKESDEGIKEVNGKMVAWFSSVEIDLDATEDGAKFGALASYEEVYDLNEKVGKRLTEAELILHGDGTSANAGLIARVKEDEEWISAAALTLYGDSSTAQAGLVARVGENEVAILATATDLGTRIDLKADETWVKDLIADRISAAKSEIEYAISENIVTDYLIAYDNIQSFGWISGETLIATSGFEFKGDEVSKQTITVVTGISGATLTTTDVDVLATDVGESTTLSFWQRGEMVDIGLYKEGKEMAVAGEIYEGVLYQANGYQAVVGDPVTLTRVKLEGTPYQGNLYDADGVLVSSGSNPTLCVRDGNYVNRVPSGVTEVYKPGSYVRTVLDTDMWFVGGTFCYAGQSVRVQGDEFPDTVFYTGRKVTIDMQEITALTA